MSPWWDGRWLEARGPVDATILAEHHHDVLVQPLRALDPDGPFPPGLLPSTAGSETPEDAVATALLAQEITGLDRVLLEVSCPLGPNDARFPDVEGLLEACRTLGDRGLQLAARCTPDPVVCCRLYDLGCVALLVRAEPPDVEHLSALVPNTAPARALRLDGAIATPGAWVLPFPARPR